MKQSAFYFTSLFIFLSLCLSAVNLLDKKEKPAGPVFNTNIVRPVKNGGIDERTKDWIKSSALGFEENLGQFADESGKPIPFAFFKTSAKGIDMYLTDKGLTYVFIKSNHKHEPGLQENDEEPVYYSRVDVELLGASIKKENIIKEDAHVASFNYYLPNCPQGISAKKYSKVIFKEIYKGIDWVWYTANSPEGQEIVKYDFIVYPGADPGQIKMLYKWADLHSKGKELEIRTPLGSVIEGKAQSYCEGKEVKTEYLLDQNTVSFNIESYNSNETLIIDPPLNLIWGTYFGGGAWEKLTDLSNAIDAAGNNFVTGNTLSTNNFPNINPGGTTYFQGTYGGGGGIQGKGGDICILKFSNAGVLIWCTYYGGSNHDNGNSVTIDPTGNVYITGCSVSTNFPLTNLGGAFNQGIMAGGSGLEGGDAVILKFSNTGTCVWSTFYGGSANDVGRSVVCDNAGNLFVTGWTASTNFPTNNPGGGAYFQGASGGGNDLFFIKFSNTGVQQWSTYYGGSGSDIAHYICTDPSNNLLVAGESASSNFPTTNPGGGAYFQGTNAGLADAVIIKMSTGGVINWSTFYGGGGIDVGRGIASNGAGHIYITGQTASLNLPTLNSGGGAYFQGANAGGSDGFFARFSNTGVHLWGTYYGGSAVDDAAAVIVDNCLNVYATGRTYSTDLPTVNPGGGAFFIANKLASDDVWFASFDPVNKLQWSTYNGTTGFDEKGTSLKVDTFGNLFIVGWWCFYSTSNAMANPGAGAYFKGNIDADDFFIAKFNLAACVSTCSFVASGGYSCPSGGSATSFSLNVGAIGGYTSSPTFTWAGPGSFSSTQQNPVFPNGAYGVYTVTGSNGGCSYTATVSLVNSLITPTATPIATITCVTNGAAIATPTLPAGYTYLWGGPGIVGANNQQSVQGNIVGNYTVTITNTSTGCQGFDVAPIVEDKTVVTASIQPSTTQIQCGIPAQTFTGQPAPLNNYSYQWLTPCGAPFAGYIISPGCCGVYTFEVTNTQNGCKATKTSTVTCVAGIPSITVTATNSNYYVTCVTCVTMQITASLTGGGGGGIGVNWQNATGSTTLSTSNTYTTCTPGNYLAFANNLAAPNCSVAQLVTVLQNTVTPAAGFTTAIWGTQNPTLTCYNPCAILTGTSTALSYSVGWETPGTVPDVTLSVCATTNTTQTTVSTPSVVITDLINGCVKKLPVPVYQDIKPVGLIAKSTPSLLTCNVIQSQLQYTPNPLSSLHTWTWTSPPPTTTVSQVNPIDVYNPGTYTISATNTQNGCVSSATVILGLNNLPPAVQAVPDGTIACGSTTTQISAGVTSTVGNTYFWDGPPGASIQSITSYAPKVDMPGSYYVSIQNTITGCYNENTVTVVPGAITVTFTPDPIEGYSPLNVTFLNGSTPGSTSLWAYGNGSTQSSTATINGNTIYNSPGTYTVILVGVRGICTDTAWAIIKVDIPSKLTPPNVFTPNNDGINDTYILHTANLTHITATIFDRWGVKIYEVSTEKGNIAWDGTNLAGKEVPEGTYYYIITATGKDAVEYEEKGFISLYR